MLLVYFIKEFNSKKLIMYPKLPMKTLLFFCLATLYCGCVFGQKADTWIAIWNKDESLIGFKSENGKVKIKPKFMGYTVARKFDEVIAVTEKNKRNWVSYYTNKDGKIFGRDSLHIFDNGADCESEGFIRFRDAKTDKVGMFNKLGNVIIPAIYNDLSKTHNGLIMALKDAEKKYWDKDKHEGCNHFSWEGGQELLIDTLNHILVENFKLDYTLNLFSLQMAKLPSSDTTRKSFLSKEGAYYSFVDFEAELKQWIITELLHQPSVEKLKAIANDTIIWEASNGWEKTNGVQLIENNYNLIINGLLEILQPQTQFSIYSNGLNPYMFEGPEYEQYYDNCGESKTWIFPVLSIIVSHESDTDFTQNHYDFLRTEHGFKLVSLTIRNGSIK